jgi:PhzF family phenazine biosynthesis protein
MVVLSDHSTSPQTGAQLLWHGMAAAMTDSRSVALHAPGAGQIWYIDAFAGRSFAGNPAAVCLLNEEADERWMQSLARETNLPATVFARPDGDAFSLRWFSPATELAFCGHGTLAAAHALWESGNLDRSRAATFQTPAGRLGATWRDGWVELDLPAERAHPVAPPADLLHAVGVSPRACARNRFDYLLELESEAAVRAVTPNLALLRAVATRGVIVTAPSATPGYDFVSRFFAPSAGIDEDSVTGSAHCCLGPYWAGRLGRDDLTGYQASARGGIVRVHVRGERVALVGQAVMVARARATPGAMTYTSGH